MKRAFIGLPFLLIAHLFLWPTHVLLGLVLDATGVAVITWPRKRKTYG